MLDGRGTDTAITIICKILSSNQPIMTTYWTKSCDIVAFLRWKKCSNKINSYTILPDPHVYIDSSSQKRPKKRFFIGNGSSGINRSALIWKDFTVWTVTISNCGNSVFVRTTTPLFEQWSGFYRLQLTQFFLFSLILVSIL